LSEVGQSHVFFELGVPGVLAAIAVGDLFPKSGFFSSYAITTFRISVACVPVFLDLVVPVEIQKEGGSLSSLICLAIFR
jgi:hypothetical protein